MNIRKKSKKQEKNDAEFFGGKCQPGSGACWGAKGDVKCENYLIENKYTDTNKYSFKLSLWDKLQTEAIREGLRLPLFRVDIKDIKLVIWECNFLPSFCEQPQVLVVPISVNNKSYTLEYETLRKLILDAFYRGILVIRLTIRDRKFIVMLREDFKDFVDDCLEV